MTGCGDESGLITVDQALALILKHTQALGSECLDLNRALDRYLSTAIYSPIDLPLFSQSAVDGYALCAESDLAKVIPPNTQFELIGELQAGHDSALKLEMGQAVRIFTGAKIPQGTTTVARQEIVQVMKSAQIRVTEHLKADVDIRHQAEEIARGQVLAHAGQQLSVGAIASLSMAGVQQVEVFKYPKVAVVITGDEVASSVEDLGAGKIFDANAPLIQAWFQDKCQRVNIFHVEDTRHILKALLHRLSKSHELILSTGGVSVGDYDFIRPVSLDLGFEQIFWKVKQKPAKPMLFSKLMRDDASACYLLGLPGNPAAVYVGMQVYAATLLNAMQGQRKQPNGFTAVLGHDLKPDSRERLLRMTAEFDQSVLKVQRLSNQQSHMLSNLMQANALVRIPAAEDLSQGQIVQGWWI